MEFDDRNSTWSESAVASCRLTDTERDQLIDALDADDPDEFNDDLVELWERGDMNEIKDTFAFSNPVKAWNRVTDAARKINPTLNKVLAVPAALRESSSETLHAAGQHVGSDEWKKAEYERRQELAAENAPPTLNEVIAADRLGDAPGCVFGTRASSWTPYAKTYALHLMSAGYDAKEAWDAACSATVNNSAEVADTLHSEGLISDDDYNDIMR